MYRDGSAENTIKNSNDGAYANIFSFSCTVEKYSDNFNGEIAAISFGIDKLKECPGDNIALLIDSQTTI